MINIILKEDCCGCEACRQVCPKQCIKIEADEQGFVYPRVDTSLCIDCHLCEKVCPVLNQAAERLPEGTYAATNVDSAVKERSSSGGVFFALAESVIGQGGVVFGVKFNENWQPVHAWADNLDGVKAFQGSKYVQSRIGDSFAQAATFLKQGRKVMFTGTPCQVAGLRLFLRKDYGEQLLTVDVACHGTPSPAVWSEYLSNIARPQGAPAGKNTDFSSLNDAPVVTGISFRDKRNGWEKYGFSLRVAATSGSGQNSDFYSVIDDKETLFEHHRKNLFMQGFLHDIYLRPACYACSAKAGKSGADITLADFWGIQRNYPELYAKGLYSLVLANTLRGKHILESLKSISIAEADYQKALVGNPALIRSVRRPKAAAKFWQEFPVDGLAAITRAVKRTTPSMIRRIAGKLKSIAKRILK